MGTSRTLAAATSAATPAATARRLRRDGGGGRLSGQAGQQPAYGEHARSYDRDTGAFQRYRRAVVEELPLRRGQVDLDVGYGTGLCCSLLREKMGPRRAVVGIEESPEMAAVAREHIASEECRNVTVVESSAEDAEIARTADAALSGCPRHPAVPRRAGE